ncbi:MAG: siderophore-interacting protein, partial [Actinomadura sp.]
MADAAAPYRFFDVHVVRTERLGLGAVRITFGGDRLAAFHSDGRDQRFKLFLPHPHQDAPVVPTESGDEWFTHWRAMDPEVRAVMRSYTVRELRREPDEVDVDFALHGDRGPASRWAARARP